MPFMPFAILGMWFRGLLSIAILGGAGYLIWRWYDESRVTVVETSPSAEVAAGEPADPSRGVPAARRREFRLRLGANRETALLAGGVALLAWATLGRLIGAASSRMASGSAPGASSKDEPRDERTGEVVTLKRPDGSALHVEMYGPPDAPPIVFSHGWGSDSTQWYYAKKHLADRFRVIVWDEPGLGLSTKAADDNFSMERFAEDLDAVLGLAGGRPAVVVGHSIGGMATLTYCRTHADALGSRVAGLVLVHTTYTNPVRTASGASFYTALEKPVIVPLLYLTIATWPLAWLMNWMSYLNGSIHRSTRSGSFGGTQTEAMVHQIASRMPRARPDVLARGMLGMLAYDATATLPGINVPVLVVVGDKDTTTLPEAGEHMAWTIPGAKLHKLAPAKHVGLMEHHGEFDAAVAGFAAKCQATVPA